MLVWLGVYLIIPIFSVIFNNKFWKFELHTLYFSGCTLCAQKHVILGAGYVISNNNNNIFDLKMASNAWNV